jgi:hypothetical protein
MLRYFALVPLLMMAATLPSLGFASELPQQGNRYEVIRPLYLMATYNSLNNRQISRDTAGASLHAVRYYDTAWVAFQIEVPAGTIMTIISPPSKVWNLPFRVTRYFVRLEPDQSRGLDIELTLDRGIQGSLNGLNPEIFRALQ